MLTASTLAMTLVGLIAASGFAVMAQRRQRQLGLLSAIGATTRHVRMAVVSNGLILGVIAAVLGTAAGVGGWLLAAPAVEVAANHRIDRFDLPWALIAVLASLAIVVATAGGVVAGTGRVAHPGDDRARRADRHVPVRSAARWPRPPCSSVAA